MRLSLHQLNVLLRIKQKKSISLAAKSLHMTQPAASNIIKQLEELYQTKLTKRLNRETLLTSAGLILSEAAEKIQNLLLETENKIQIEKNVLSGQLSVSAVSTAKYFVPRLLASFKKQHPLIKAQLTVGNRENIINRIKNNLDDVVIMSQPPKDIKIEVTDFYDDQLVVAASANSLLSKKKHHTLSGLANEDWLIREVGSGTRIVMEKLFKLHKIKPIIASEVSNNESIKQLIIAGMGISIISLQSIELELDSNLITVLPVRDFPKKHKWYMVKSNDSIPNASVQAFETFVETHSDLAHFHSWKGNVET